MSARDRFVQARDAVAELAIVQALIAEHGEDWQPETVGHSQNFDAVANKAIYNVEVWSVREQELKQRESELLDIIGKVLRDIEKVRGEFGDEYAEILDQRYIDCLPWSQVEYDGERVKLSTGKKYVAVAFRWLDEN